MRAGWVLTSMAAVACSSCALFLPPRSDPHAEAREREEATCPVWAPPAYPPGLFEGRSVVRVDPLYSTVIGADSKRLAGAVLALRPVPGVTSEGLEALLNCHNARRELARAGEPSPPDDPYWVPDRRIAITVHFEGGALRAEVRAKDFDTAQSVLFRAAAFTARAGR